MSIFVLNKTKKWKALISKYNFSAADIEELKIVDALILRID